MINDSQRQVIQLTSCSPVVGGSLRRLSPTKTGLHNIAEILLKVALNTKNQNLEKNVIRRYFNLNSS